MYQINNKEIKQKRIKKVLLVIGIILIIWISFGIYINTTSKTKKELEKIGYSNIEISIIQDILNNKDLKIIFDYNYIKNLTDILVSNDFNSSKINNYLTYLNKYPTISNEDLIYIINNELDNLEYNEFTKKVIHHSDFDFNKMNRYNTYYNKYKLSIDDTVFAVNNDFDIYNIKYNNEYNKYMNKNYFIMSNIDRYHKYALNNKNVDVDKIISLVNSNLDLNPYTNSKQADISKSNLILVNKYYYLNPTYIPDNLVDIEPEFGNGQINTEVYEAFKSMYESAKKNDISIYILKGYISYSAQYKLYTSNRRYYERAGYSENQTGLIIEIQNNEWLEKNAHKYGFIQRYPTDKKDITGHDKANCYRYVGTEVSKFIYKNKVSYEEYYAYFVEQ